MDAVFEIKARRNIFLHFEITTAIGWNAGDFSACQIFGARSGFAVKKTAAAPVLSAGSSIRAAWTHLAILERMIRILGDSATCHDPKIQRVDTAFLFSWRGQF